MTTLSRQTQKVFGSAADADQLAVFGSMKTGTPQYSTNLSTLQSQEYTEGWSEAILNDKAPYLEEMNAVQYGLSYQIAYMLQEGAFEYDANTNYSDTSLVKVINNNELELYHSLTDNNKGNPLTDTSNWQRVYFTTIGAIGQPQFTLDFSTLPDNCIWLEGAEVSRTTYADLFAIYGTTYGEGDGSTTFNLPDFRDKAVWGGTTAGYLESGIPNIYGTFGSDFSQYLSGAFYYAYNAKNNDGNGAGFVAGFDASRCSSVYKNDVTTVQPPSIKVRVYTRYQ